MEAGIGDSAQLAFEAIGNRNLSRERVLAELPLLVQAGVTVVEGKRPLAIEAHPFGSFELRFRKLGAWGVGGLEGAGGQKHEN